MRSHSLVGLPLRTTARPAARAHSIPTQKVCHRAVRHRYAHLQRAVYAHLCCMRQWAPHHTCEVWWRLPRPVCPIAHADWIPTKAAPCFGSSCKLQRLLPGTGSSFLASTVFKVEFYWNPENRTAVVESTSFNHSCTAAETWGVLHACGTDAREGVTTSSVVHWRREQREPASVRESQHGTQFARASAHLLCGCIAEQAQCVVKAHRARKFTASERTQTQ